MYSYSTDCRDVSDLLYVLIFKYQIKTSEYLLQQTDNMSKSTQNERFFERSVFNIWPCIIRSWQSVPSVKKIHVLYDPVTFWGRRVKLNVLPVISKRRCTFYFLLSLWGYQIRSTCFYRNGNENKYIKMIGKDIHIV